MVSSYQAILSPSRIHLLIHSWKEEYKRDTINLLDSYLGYHYPGIPLTVSFDEQPIREVECHLDFDYVGLLPSEREAARLIHIKALGAYVGDVIRYFVKLDSFNRMKAARLRRGEDHDAYGLGAGTETIPYPPHGPHHMPRSPMTFDRTLDGSKLYTGPITPGSTEHLETP